VFQLSFESAREGDHLPELKLPPITRLQLALYCGGSGDHNPIHVDTDFARRLATLSAREMEIVQGVKLGKSNTEIAGLSVLSENTVKHHLTRIFGKLAVETRTQMVQQLAEHEAKVAPELATKIV